MSTDNQEDFPGINKFKLWCCDYFQTLIRPRGQQYILRIGLKNSEFDLQNLYNSISLLVLEQYRISFLTVIIFFQFYYHHS